MEAIPGATKVEKASPTASTGGWRVVSIQDVCDEIRVK
jgi:hypothetical protein